MVCRVRGTPGGQGGLRASKGDLARLTESPQRTGMWSAQRGGPRIWSPARTFGVGVCGWREGGRTKGRKKEERKEGKRERREENGVSQLLNVPSATKLCAIHGMGGAGELGARVLPGVHQTHPVWPWERPFPSLHLTGLRRWSVKSLLALTL